VALGAPRRGLIGIATEGTIRHYFDLRQQRSQRSGGGRLGRAALAPNEHATDLGMDGVKYQSAFHTLLSYNSRKRKNR
jgi:hypothetical protein